MKKDEALQAILKEWQSLPESERQTDSQLVAFAFKMASHPDYLFKGRGDRYQDIMAFMGQHVAGLKQFPRGETENVRRRHSG